MRTGVLSQHSWAAGYLLKLVFGFLTQNFIFFSWPCLLKVKTPLAEDGAAAAKAEAVGNYSNVNYEVGCFSPN